MHFVVKRHFLVQRQCLQCPQWQTHMQCKKEKTGGERLRVETTKTNSHFWNIKNIYFFQCRSLERNKKIKSADAAWDTRYDSVQTQDISDRRNMSNAVWHAWLNSMPEVAAEFSKKRFSSFFFQRKRKMVSPFFFAFYCLFLLLLPNDFSLSSYIHYPLTVKRVSGSLVTLDNGCRISLL